jgi:hypothetical protein
MGLLAWTDLAALGRSTGVLRITSQPPATVSVDGLRFGQTPIDLRQPLGRHLVQLSHPGFTTLRKWIEVGDTPRDLDLALQHADLALQQTTPSAETADRPLPAGARRPTTCYEQGRARNPHLPGGTVVLRIVTAADGHVSDAQVDSNTLGDAQVADCLRRQAAGWVFERARDTTILYPFVFRSRD